jgi:undecaprenyl-diphosphatase
MARPASFADPSFKRGGVANRLHALDLLLVRAAARSTKLPVIRKLAVAITKLGNGGIYPVMTAAVMIRCGFPGFRIIIAALTTTGILHAIYPRIKRRFLRARPYMTDTTLECLVTPLDRYSFPSGHTMTLTGVFVPVVVFWHAALPAGIVMGFCLAWSRLATAHHYPSDVLAGALLGMGVGFPIAGLATWFW